MSWWAAERNGQDSVGSNHASFNSLSYGPGQVGNAFVFAGNGDEYVEFGQQPVLNQGFTFSAWVNIASGDSFGETQTLINNNQFFLRKQDVEGSNRFATFVNLADGGPTDGLQSVTEIVPDKWYHVASTWDGQSLALYINGVLEGQTRREGILTPDPAPTRLGSGELMEASIQWLGGLLDEVRLHSRALTYEEVELLYNLNITSTQTDPDADGSGSAPGTLTLIIERPYDLVVVGVELQRQNGVWVHGEGFLQQELSSDGFLDYRLSVTAPSASYTRLRIRLERPMVTQSDWINVVDTFPIFPGATAGVNQRISIAQLEAAGLEQPR